MLMQKWCHANPLIAQYMKLSGFDHYVLVGNFMDKTADIEFAYKRDATFSRSKHFFPQINYYQSLPNSLMRRMVAGVTGLLVVSTGTTSRLKHCKIIN